MRLLLILESLRRYPCVERVSIKNDSKSKKALTNEQIEAPMVRLIDADGTQVGIVSNAEAMDKAEAAGMDLVMMADGETPVCKIMDYGKHIFEAKKQKAAQKKKAKRTQIKEMKFRPGTDEGDYQVKLRSLTRFWKTVTKPR